MNCVTCAYYQAFGMLKEQHYCLHPKNQSVVTGTGNGALTARQQDGVCGPQAHLHSSRNIPFESFSKVQ